MPVAAIENITCSAVKKVLKRADVGIRKIDYMDIVSYAGPVGCVIIGPVDSDVRPFP